MIPLKPRYRANVEKQEKEQRLNPGKPAESNLEDGFVGSAKDKLDDLFGG